MKTLKDLMTTHILQAQKDEPVISVARIMSENKISCMVVADEGKPIGMITERDMIKKIIAQGIDPHKTKVNKIMTTPIESVPPDTTLERALEIMEDKKIRRLIVAKNNRLEGLATQTDILKETKGIQKKNISLMYHQNLQSYIIIAAMVFILGVVVYTLMRKFV